MRGDVVAIGDEFGCAAAGDIVRRELRWRVGQQRSHLRRSDGVIRDQHFIHHAVEQRIGGELALAEKIHPGTEASMVGAPAGGGGDDSAVEENPRVPPPVVTATWCPLVLGRSRGFDVLLAAAIADGKTHRAARGAWREKQVMRRAIAEIKDALPVRAAAPIDPARKSERVAGRHVLRQGDDSRRIAVEHERLSGDAIGEGGRPAAMPLLA